MLAMFIGLAVALVLLISIVVFQRSRGTGNKGLYESSVTGTQVPPDNRG